MSAMSANATMGAEPLTPPQEAIVNVVDTEMTCLLTSDPEDRSIRSLSPDKMSNFNNPYYSGNGEAGPSGPRRSSGFGGQGGEHSSSQAAGGTNPGTFGSFGNYASPTAEGGMFAMSPTGMGGGGPMVNYGPTPFGVAPPIFTGGPRGRLNSFQQNPNEVILSAVNPGPVYATNEQLDVAFGYGFRREDGTFTRLIPADSLPQHLTAQMNLPARQGSEGLIIVAPPRQLSPNSRRGAPIPSVPRDLVARLPVYDPAGPQYTTSPPANGQGSMNAIMAQSFSPTAGSFQGNRSRREKVYCDKWLHDGICAFTQMGCRYKHEMPMDRATQVSLGLNHGLPGWYRRAAAVELHPRGALPAIAPPPPPPPPPANRMQGSWRREEGVGSSSGLGGFGNMGSPPPFIHRQHALGPIGPPPPSRDLKREEGEVDEYGEELLWKREGKGKRRQDEGSA